MDRDYAKTIRQSMVCVIVIQHTLLSHVFYYVFKYKKKTKQKQKYGSFSLKKKDRSKELRQNTTTNCNRALPQDRKDSFACSSMVNNRCDVEE